MIKIKTQQPERERKKLQDISSNSERTHLPAVNYTANSAGLLFPSKNQEEAEGKEGTWALKSS